jgi:hypothetical protein
MQERHAPALLGGSAPTLLQRKQNVGGVPDDFLLAPAQKVLGAWFQLVTIPFGSVVRIA